VEVWQTSKLCRLRLGEEKKKLKEEETTGQKYNGLPYSIGRPLAYKSTGIANTLDRTDSNETVNNSPSCESMQ